MLIFFHATRGESQCPELAALLQRPESAALQTEPRFKIIWWKRSLDGARARCTWCVPSVLLSVLWVRQLPMVLVTFLIVLAKQPMRSNLWEQELIWVCIPRLQGYVVHLGGEDAAVGKRDGFAPISVEERECHPSSGFLLPLIQSRTPAYGLMMSHSVWVLPSVHPL